MKIDPYTLRDAIREYFQEKGAEVIRAAIDKKGREFFIARIGNGVYKISVERVS